MRDEKYITKVVAASLLGDAYVGYNKTRNPSFEITLTEAHKDHLEQIEQVLLPLTGTSWYYINPEQKVIQGKSTHSKGKWRLRTKSHPFFKPFRERMYPNGHKVVDPHYLTLLDWEFLAIWFMQDGCLSGYISKKKYPQLKMKLSTNGFSYADNHYLRIKLKETLDIDASVCLHTTVAGSRTYFLQFSANDIKRICDEMSKFMTNSFLYKIDYTSTLERIGANVS